MAPSEATMTEIGEKARGRDGECSAVGERVEIDLVRVVSAVEAACCEKRARLGGRESATGFADGNGDC